jgi:serine phosphatase RsbU (regulator of sigma subunit)
MVDTTLPFAYSWTAINGHCRIRIMEAQIAVSKIGKYATSESGDTIEMIERPGGGLSFVLVDGQRSGKSAKAISNVVARKAISLLADGVRDGAAARAASDYLYTHRSGKVMATLNILSIDLISQTMVIVRNNPAPVLLIQNGIINLLDETVDAVGTRREIRPSITEIPLELNLVAIVFTDGLVHAGDRSGKRMDIIQCVEDMQVEGPVDPKRWADRLLNHAVNLDQGRPSDDITVLVVAILPDQGDDARQLIVRMPL